MRKPKLVPNAKQLWRYNSQQAMAVVVALQSWWALTPQAWIDSYPKWVTPAVAYSTAALTVAAVVFQYFKQDLPPVPPKDAAP